MRTIKSCYKIWSKFAAKIGLLCISKYAEMEEWDNKGMIFLSLNLVVTKKDCKKLDQELLYEFHCQQTRSHKV